MEINQVILEKIHTAIFEASADDARVAIELLKKVNEEQLEEAMELIEIATIMETPGKPLPPAIENIVKDPEVIEMVVRSEEHTSELQSRRNLVCRLLLEKKKTHTHQKPKI